MDLVALNVSVVDTHQRFVNSLGPDDFQVYENGVPRDLAFFGTAAVPVDVVLLLDISASMRDKMEIIADAAVGFVRALRPGDRAAVIGFADRFRVLQPMTADLDHVEHAVRQAQASGMTALYDALYIAANELVRERRTFDDLRRQALLVLTDGRDTASLTAEHDALTAIRRAGVPVYTISPEQRLLLSQRVLLGGRPAWEAPFMLRSLAQDTGGRVFFLEDLKRLAGVYAEIAAEIAHQYTLAFEPDDRRWGARFRQILVRVVSHPDAIVRARRGYDPRLESR
ncbi:MAG: VWA domain-containing protein [Acidobacteria bacterium]|nr:VWA domain-containing protein [Acidobacteriota bacterium]